MKVQKSKGEGGRGESARGYAFPEKKNENTFSRMVEKEQIE